MSTPTKFAKMSYEIDKIRKIFVQNYEVKFLLEKFWNRKQMLISYHDILDRYRESDNIMFFRSNTEKWSIRLFVCLSFVLSLFILHFWAFHFCSGIFITFFALIQALSLYLSRISCYPYMCVQHTACLAYHTDKNQNFIYLEKKNQQRRKRKII